MSTKTRRLKSMLTSKDAAVLMEAHNGLSAKLAQEAGFQALWGSGLLGGGWVLFRIVLPALGLYKLAGDALPQGTGF